MKALNKAKATSIVLVLAMIVGSSLLIATPASAHTPPWDVPTYVYLIAAPNPVAPNQQTVLSYWVNMQPPTATSNSGYRWQNITINITKPDGSTVYYGDLISDPSGSGYVEYTPDSIGKYTATVNFPTQVLTRINSVSGIAGPDSAYVNDTYLASSANTTFIVQPVSVKSFQEPPLPVSYWTRPIDSNLKTWNSIASNWLGQNEFGATYLRHQPSGWAPNTAHVLWTYPLAWGGIAGSDNTLNEGANFYSGLHRTKFNNPIIIAGTLFFSLPQGNAASGGGVTAVDLRTGQTKWTNTALSNIAFGQLLDYESPNERGIMGGYLWYSGAAVGTGITNPGPEAVKALSNSYAPETVYLGRVAAVTNPSQAVNNTESWIALDPITGKSLFNLTNVPSAVTIGSKTLVNTPVRVYGPQGELLLYSIGRQNSSAPYTYLWQWNNTKLPGYDAPIRVPAWEPGITNWNMSTAYDWNVTLSQALEGTTNKFGSYDPAIISVFPGNIIFGQSSGLQQTTGLTSGNFGTSDPYTLWAINLNSSRGQIGQILWQKTYPAPSDDKTVLIGPSDGETNVFTLYYRETMQWLGYNLLTGDYLWGPTAPENELNYYNGVGGSIISPNAIGYGRLYSTGYSGILYSYDLKTGQLIFTYGNDANDPNNSTATSEVAYGAYPLQIGAIADNKIYLSTIEHTLSSPPYQGAKTRAIDALSGKELWSVYGMSSWRTQAIADGYYVWLNFNDMQIYATGPGPSAVTVTAPDIGIPVGTPIEIRGTITDQSPALKGTAAISDADQGTWTNYIIQHNTIQPDATGVPVQITITAQDGTIMEKATVISESSGLFHYPWTAQAPGEYCIIANFTGTQSYGPSSAKTSIIVSEISTHTPTPIATLMISPTTTTQTSSAFPIANPHVIVVLITIVAIVAVTIIGLKKRL